jgi:hypothetical protein
MKEDLYMYRALTSKTLETAHRRMLGLRYLDPEMNFGKGLSVPDFTDQVETMKAKLDAYNEMVNALKQERESLDAIEKTLRGTSERILGAVGSLYGKESDEYEVAGGVKRGKRSRRKAGEPAATAQTEGTGEMEGEA